MGKYDKIVLMCPTYKRSGTLLNSFLTSAIKTADDVKRLQFCLCVNHKDAETIEFLRNYDFSGADHEVVIEETRQPNLAKYFNMMYYNSRFCNSGGNRIDTIVSMLGDDMEFITQGWDTAIINSINGKNGIGIHYCDDDYIAHEALCVNFFATTMYVDAATDCYMEELFAADMIDVVWYNCGLFSKTLVYISSVIIRHNHNTRKDKKYFDETFERLAPVQAAANTLENQFYGKGLGSEMAKRLILRGIGESVFEVLN